MELWALGCWLACCDVLSFLLGCWLRYYYYLFFPVFPFARQRRAGGRVGVFPEHNVLEECHACRLRPRRFASCFLPVLVPCL